MSEDTMSTQEAAPAKGLNGKLKRVAMIALPIILLAGIGGWFYSRNRVSTDDAQVDGHMAPVSARVYGSVEAVLADDNQQVKAGDVLVRLDARDIQAKVDQAKAALDAALADAKAAGADTDKAEVSVEQARTSNVAVAEAELDAKRATFAKAQSDLQRMQPLADRQEISAQSLDSFKASSEVAASELRSAQQKLDAAKQEARIRQVAVQSQGAKAMKAAASVEEAKARLAALELELSYCTIKAPVDGIVTRKSVQLGQIVQPGQGLMTLVPLHESFVTANYKETQLAKVRPGQKAEVEIDMSGRTLHGVVDSVAASTGAKMSLLPPENATGNFVKVVQRIPVKIKVDEKEAQDAGLRPGMNVETTILTD